METPVPDVQGPEPHMFGWFMERSESEDPELQRMVRMILDRVQPK